MIPSIAQVGKGIERLFVMEDWHNFGADYDKTLMAWARNFEEHWPEIAGRYGETFHRMWRFYLLSSAGLPYERISCGRSCSRKGGFGVDTEGRDKGHGAAARPVYTMNLWYERLSRLNRPLN